MVENASREIPRWLVVSTVAFTLLILAMAVAETNLWMHFLVDRGEYISVAGVVFITLVGFHLHRRKALKGSLPLFIPWLLYPVLTQGDELIDNLSINQMRLVCDIILAVIFAAPIVVGIVAMDAYVVRLSRSALTVIVMGALAVEIGVAYAFLGWYLIWTLVAMGGLFLLAAAGGVDTNRLQMADSMALKVMVAGSILSLGLFFGFKNRPGAYQGSPAAFMDPSQKDAIYDLSRISLPAASTETLAPDIRAEAHDVLAGYGDVLGGLVHAYWLMDRNYNYSFHNELFRRSTPVVPDFRTKALQEILKMRALAAVTDRRAGTLRNRLPANAPTALLVEETREFVAYNLRRATITEQMSSEFIKTKAGLQHATHLYEGEAKMLDVLFERIVEKHRGVLNNSTFIPVAAALMASAQQIHETYGNRIIGF